VEVISSQSMSRQVCKGVYYLYVFCCCALSEFIPFPDISSSPQFIADKGSPGDSVSPEISSKDDGKAQR